MEGGGAPQDGTRTPAPPHLAPAASAKPHGRPHMAAVPPAPAPAGRAAAEGGRHGRGHGHSRCPGVQHGRGGALVRGWGGWLGGGLGRARERGRRRTKVLRRGREKRSALPNAQKPCW